MTAFAARSDPSKADELRFDVDRCRELGAKLLHQADAEANRSGAPAFSRQGTDDQNVALGLVAELTAIGEIDRGAKFFNRWRRDVGHRGQAIATNGDNPGLLVVEERAGGYSLVAIDRRGPDQLRIECSFVAEDDAVTLSWLAVLTA
jgi:hypothetical protein